MIQELRIQNFAIIDHLELNFKSGLVILTGETGAGKSIIIDAVEALLGSRTDTTMVRTGADKALLEATFEIPETVRSQVHALLVQENLLDDPNLVSISREIRSNARTIARVNGRIINLGLLKQLGEFLVDVHGQSEHLSLLRVSQHLDLLDSFADVRPLKEGYQDVYHHLQQVRRELETLRQAESEAARRTDILNFQINEIDSARLRPDEEDGLREERNRLANAEGLATEVQAAFQLLDEGSPESPSATDLLGQALNSISSLARLDPSQSKTEEQARDLFEQLEELVLNLRNYFDGIEFNPKRLDQVEERLNLIQLLKRKYGRGSSATIQEVLDFARQARQQLDEISHAEERIELLMDEESKLLEKISTLGQSLSTERHKAAEKMAADVENELQNLSMDRARFRVEFTTQPDPTGVPFEGEKVAFDATGLERIEFLVAPNPGEGFKPLVKIASGGETSRLMLAIKNVLARADLVPTLIFDEIDQGIGGRVGAIVGHKLWGLARQHQVLCVTHLPQLAAFGEQHLQVLKTVHAGRTTTQVMQLEDDDRLHELASMMGNVNDNTRGSARELLRLVEQIKNHDHADSLPDSPA
jgi:DNA repair protein RecN (Recombination protein N)